MGFGVWGLGFWDWVFADLVVRGNCEVAQLRHTVAAVSAGEGEGGGWGGEKCQEGEGEGGGT